MKVARREANRSRWSLPFSVTPPPLYPSLPLPWGSGQATYQGSVTGRGRQIPLLRGLPEGGLKDPFSGVSATLSRIRGPLPCQGLVWKEEER